jgi:hypothetical protein
MVVNTSAGTRGASGGVSDSYGFRPAGVFLENVTICEELCFFGKLFLFQREQVALQNLDQKWLNSLRVQMFLKLAS